MSVERILACMKQQITDQLYPGASVAIYQNGKWQEHYLGHSDPDKGLSTQAGLVYDLASVSKVVGVGTLCAFLVTKGRLELDRPLQFYYPAFQNASVTIRQLLTHTSGLDPYIPNRNQLNTAELTIALQRLDVLDNRSFHYTDVNFLLLGFMLEYLYQKDLASILSQEIFQPWQMTSTSFGPVKEAVPTVRKKDSGVVHDPKAQVLGIHAGSAGLFSTIKDLERFLEHYLKDDFAAYLTQNFSQERGKERSLAWNLEGEWLDHTGYTGTFIMYHRAAQKAVIFLSNRTYHRDERAYWIVKRNQVMEQIRRQV